jgi:TonB family protein
MVAAMLAAFAGCTGTHVPRSSCEPLCGLGQTPDERPRLLSFPRWILPRDRQDAHAADRVRVRVLIDDRGNAASAVALDAVPELDTVAVGAALHTAWQPARMGGIAIAVWETLSVFGCAPLDFAYYEEQPVLISMPVPVYPPEALEQGIEGTVFVQARIGLDGSVWCAQVQKSIPVLDTAAVDAVWHSQWIAGQNQNAPVVVWVVIPFRFMLSHPLDRRSGSIAVLPPRPRGRGDSVATPIESVRDSRANIRRSAGM